jgi:hypothetical protein
MRRGKIVCPHTLPLLRKPLSKKICWSKGDLQDLKLNETEWPLLPKKIPSPISPEYKLPVLLPYTDEDIEDKEDEIISSAIPEVAISEFFYRMRRMPTEKEIIKMDLAGEKMGHKCRKSKRRKSKRRKSKRGKPKRRKPKRRKSKRGKPKRRKSKRRKSKCGKPVL